MTKPPLGEVEITVVRRDCRSRHGLRVHRVETLDRRDSAKRRGIPVTAPARTLIDYASTTGADEAERAIAEAFALKLVTEPQLRAAIDRFGNIVVWIEQSARDATVGVSGVATGS